MSMSRNKSKIKLSMVYLALLSVGCSSGQMSINNGGSSNTGGYEESGGSGGDVSAGGSSQGGSDGSSLGGSQSGGSSGSGGSQSGGSSQGGTTPVVYTKAVVDLNPIEPFKVGGRIDFSINQSSILEMNTSFNNCTLPYYSVFIIAGTVCPKFNETPVLWDGMRGTSVTMMMCDIPRTYYHGNNSQPYIWTIGDGTISDIIGHPIILNEYHPTVSSFSPLACGIIRGLE